MFNIQEISLKTSSKKNLKPVKVSKSVLPHLLNYSSTLDLDILVLGKPEILSEVSLGSVVLTSNNSLFCISGHNKKINGTSTVNLVGIGQDNKFTMSTLELEVLNNVKVQKLFLK